MIYDNVKNVAAAGTREALVAARTPAAWLIVQAKLANTDNIFIGGSTIASGRGIVLQPGESMTFPSCGSIHAYDLQGIYIDAAVNGEGVTFAYARV